jgi:hypothetical protein
VPQVRKDDPEAVFPFPRSASERRPTESDELPSPWDDGRPCSVGCPAENAIAGWPLKPFHEQHPLRSAANERRDSGFHVGVSS